MESHHSGMDIPPMGSQRRCRRFLGTPAKLGSAERLVLKRQGVLGQVSLDGECRGSRKFAGFDLFGLVCSKSRVRRLRQMPGRPGSASSPSAGPARRKRAPIALDLAR